MAFQMNGRRQSAVQFDIDMEPPAIVLASEFTRLGLNIQSFKDPLKQSVEEVAAPSIRENFEQGGRPTWEPPAEATLDHSGYDGHPLLIDTGALEEAASSTDIWQVSKTEASILPIDSWTDYGGFHEGGTINMPARPFLMFQPEDEDAIEEIFHKWLDVRFIAAGFTPGL